MNKLLVLVCFLGLDVSAACAAAGTPTAIAREAFDLRLSGKVDEAVERLETGLAADSTQAVLHYELSRAKMFLMDFEGMQASIERAVALAPDNADYHYFAGLASAYSLINAAHKGQKEQMERFAAMDLDELEAALRCNPDHHDARCLLVQQIVSLAAETGVDQNRAEEHTRILEAKDPVMGAKARANLVPKDQRADLWETMVREHPDQWSAWYEGGAGFIDEGKLDRACIEKALEMNPQRDYILLRLGTAFAMAEDWGRAEGMTRRYLALDPPVPLMAWATARLGQIKQQSGDPASGIELMNKAMAMDPHLWRGFMPPPEAIFTLP